MCNASFTLSWIGLENRDRNENLRKEEEHLTATLKRNYYLLPFIRSISSTQKTSTSPPEEEPGEPGCQDQEQQPLAVIPYISGVSKRIRKACEKYNLNVVINPPFTTHQCEVPPPQGEPGRCMLGRRRGTKRCELKNTRMHAGRGIPGSLPLWSISGISNTKWIGMRQG